MANTINIDDFKSFFPEFSALPVEECGFWIDLGMKLNAEDRLGSVWMEAVYLFAAHNLALQMASAPNGTATTGAPGLTSSAGGVTSKSVGSVSVSYGDGSSAMDESAGHWNLTTYGIRYWRLVRLVCAVCYQLPGYRC